MRATSLPYFDHTDAASSPMLRRPLDRDDVLHLNNDLGYVINNYGSLSRLDTMKLSEYLINRGVRPKIGG